jgi:hypothetical protein
MKGKPMKLNDASTGTYLIGRANVSHNDTSDYEATHKGALSILAKSRPTANWCAVSPAVLGEIDRYVRARAGRCR